MKESSYSLKWIVSWVVFLSLSAFLFAFMFGLIFHNDWLTDHSWFALLPAALMWFVAFLILLVRWILFWRNVKRALRATSVVILLAIVFYTEEDLRGWLMWHHVKQQVEATGERLDFASIVPPSVPDDKNFALTTIVASCYENLLTKDGKRIVPPNTNVVDRLDMSIYDNFIDHASPTNGYWPKGTFIDFKEWQTYYRIPATNGDYLTNEFPIAPQPQAPAADVLLALSKYDPMLKELRQAGQLPDSRFPLNYNSEKPFDTLLPHLAAVKRCVQVLHLRALAELELGYSDKALDDVKLSLRLIDSVRTEPFLISHLVRIACLSLTTQPIWEGVNKHEWSDAQLAEIEKGLGKLDFLADCKLSMRGERNSSIATIDHVRRQRSYKEIFPQPDLVDLDYKGPGILEVFTLKIICHLLPDGWFYQNEATIAKLHQDYWLRATDSDKHLVFPAMKQEADAKIESLSITPWNYFTRMLLPALGAGERKFAYAQETADLAQLGCALERYRMAHGQFPETLDALAPQFIAQVPHDVIGGQPLHYHRKDDGKFLLYSIGWNETDDGGQIGLSDSGYFKIEKGDWVWFNP